jgi:hypothetical protein
MLDFRFPKPKPPQRLTQAREAIKRRGGCLMVVWSLTAALVVWLAGKIIDHFTDRWISRRIDPAVDLFWQAVHAPIGVVGLCLVVALCVVTSAAILLALWDSRPKRDPQPRPLTNAERDLINPLRAVWNRYGEEASSTLHSLFAEIVYNMKTNKTGIYWVDLYGVPLTQLEAGQKAMSAAVAKDSTVPFDGVLDQFKQTYGAYIAVYTWLARIEHHNPNLTDEYTPRIKAWKDFHRSYWEALQDLQQRPEYQRRLAIYQFNLPLTDPITHHFIQSAETRPERQEQP